MSWSGCFKCLVLLNHLINQAYQLTPDEIALMWRTAPPQMPIAPPPLTLPPSKR
ncbi:hypothetical protein [Spirulina major]|uniref:hypothetical protein n=1 Tax=Spirulina major TaxID=270636 RepID=UPI001587886A|nr:hypothetical protein [Spirulina major]